MTTPPPPVPAAGPEKEGRPCGCLYSTPSGEGTAAVIAECEGHRLLREEYWKVSEEVSSLRAAFARMTQERDEWEELNSENADRANRTEATLAAEREARERAEREREHAKQRIAAEQRLSDVETRRAAAAAEGRPGREGAED